MVKFLLVSACLLAAAVVCVSARKLQPSALQLKYKNLNYFENDPDITLTEDETDDNTQVHFTGDNTKAKTLMQNNFNQGKGKFQYALNTENGIKVQQAGKLKDGKTFVVQGSYSYTGADGRRYRVKYTADEFGYHPITELDVDLPDEDDNQNDIPDVAPFKPKLNSIRVQKQTPKPFVQETVTFKPVLSSRPSSAPLQHDSNPYGQPGPFVGNNYLPPNDYLPPGGAAPVRADYAQQGDFLAPPSGSLEAAASSSVFKYV